MKKNDIEVIFFDLGGVVVDFDHSRIARRLLASGNPAAPPDPQRIFDWVFHPAHGLCSDFNAGKISPEDFFSALCGKFGLHLSFESFVPIWCEIFTENPGVARIIERLKKRFRLMLISNTDPLHFPYILRTFPVLTSFEARILSYEAGVCKPDQRIYREALFTAGTAPEKTVFIDDVPEYVEAAERMGIRGIHFTSPESLEQGLKRLFPL